MCGCAFPSDSVFARARVASVCVRPGAVAWRGLAVFIARPAPRIGGRACVAAVRCHRPGSRASAAGVTWTCRTAKAEWAARFGHTSVVDAAGAIYVIGGDGRGGSASDYADVWVSTDGGARGGLGGSGWALNGGTTGYYTGSKGY